MCLLDVGVVVDDALIGESSINQVKEWDANLRFLTRPSALYLRSSPRLTTFDLTTDTTRWQMRLKLSHHAGQLLLYSSSIRHMRVCLSGCLEVALCLVSCATHRADRVPEYE